REHPVQVLPVELRLHHAALAHPDVALADHQSVTKHRPHRIPHRPTLTKVLRVIAQDVLGIVRVAEHDNGSHTQIDFVDVATLFLSLLEKVNLLPHHAEHRTNQR